MNLVFVEDHPGLRETFAQMMDRIPSHRLVAAYPSAEAARRDFQPGQADLVVVDLDLPGESGVDLIRWLGTLDRVVPSVVWTVHEGRDVVYAALKAGAVGYLVKAVGIREVEAALDEIQGGGAPMSPRIARRLLLDLVGATPTPAPSESLSARERDVLRAVARGDTHKEIAMDLGMSPHTVHSHLKKVYRKLHALGRAEAMARARQLGWIQGG